MYSFLDDMPPGVLGLVADGKVTHADYHDRLIPKVEAMTKAGPIKVLAVIHNDLPDYTLGAIWDDQMFGFKHWWDVTHMAVVTDHAWMRVALGLFSPFSPAKIRIFGLGELEAAKAWIAHPT
ncbi:MAG: STAS/SEC14 domain-containing protein [Alphaproteobacteria bacterium]|nr:STAS/SEC14 domain-containing protein [Alphaproteobacteria bacterium]